jgi:L-ascorbate metabolism protein UlaG (beta-lactamase superfamily)
MKLRTLSLAGVLVLLLASPASFAAGQGDRENEGPSAELTWMSIANWYFNVGGVRIVMDGYITRLPGPPFFVASTDHPADIFAFTQFPWLVDVQSVARVQEALPDHGTLDHLIAGHSHFDHTWDTPTWSKLTGAPIIGGLSTCYQAKTQGVTDCKVVSGGEAIPFGHGVTMRVVRFNHSGNASNPIQHFARELSGPPTPDPVTTGLRGGVGEDYPNGGGGRAFLFTVDRGGQRISFFVNNSASAFDLDQPIIVDGVNYGAPLANLAAAMKDAGLTSVDVWIGTGGAPVAQLIVPVIHPKVYIPNHWDGLFNPFWPGLPFPFKDDVLAAYLAGQGISMLPQHQYFDGYRLTTKGVTTLDNLEIKQRLGFAPSKSFSSSTVAAIRAVARTVSGEDCDQ